MKVGISRKPEGRLAQVRLITPLNDIKLFCYYELSSTDTARIVEQLVHHDMRSMNSKFKGFSGHTEWFRVDYQKAAHHVEDVLRRNNLEFTFIENKEVF